MDCFRRSAYAGSLVSTKNTINRHLTIPFSRFTILPRKQDLMTTEQLIFQKASDEKAAGAVGVLYTEGDSGRTETRDVDVTILAQVEDDSGSLLALATTAFAEDWESDADAVFDSLLEDADL